MFFRYRKNEYECTLGLVKSNLSVYYRAVSLGLSYENSLNIMIESRFMNIPLYTQKDIFHYIEQLKNIVLSNVNRMDKKNIVIKILTRIYQIENPNLSDKMKSRHKNKIIGTIEKYWNINQNPILNEPSRDVKMDNPNNKIVCPECGSIMQDPYWRCLECNSEFENFNFELNILEGDPIVKKQKDSKSNNDTCIQTAIDDSISSGKRQIKPNQIDINKDYLQIGIEAIRYFFQLNSKNLSESDIKLLIDDMETNFNSIPGIDNILNCPLFDSLFFNDNDNLKKIAGIIFIGIFRASTYKHYFLPIGLVKTYFGKSVEEYYPKNSSDEFLEFAKTFMTFKILLFKLQDNHPNKSITKLFEWLEFNVRSVFFPTPCPKIISIEIRKQAQKDILNIVNYSASIESFINGNPILNNEFEQQQLLGKNYLDQNDMSDQYKISIATKKLCSKIFDIYFSSKLNAELSAQDTVLFLAYSYCLCLFAKVGFTNDSHLLEKFHKSVKIYLLNWLNMILSRGKEIEYYESGLYKIPESMIDKFTDIFQVYLDSVKEFLPIAEKEMDLKKIEIEKIQHEFQLMAAASTATRDITSILEENYRVDIKAFDKSIHVACINAAFEIAGIEKLPNG